MVSVSLKANRLGVSEMLVNWMEAAAEGDAGGAGVGGGDTGAFTVTATVPKALLNPVKPPLMLVSADRPVVSGVKLPGAPRVWSQARNCRATVPLKPATGTK